MDDVQIAKDLHALMQANGVTEYSCSFKAPDSQEYQFGPGLKPDLTKNFGKRTLDKIVDMLKTAGVTHYCIMANDPDDNSFWDIGNGPKLWLIGVCHAMREKLTAQYNGSWEEKD